MAKWTKRNNPHTWSKGMAKTRSAGMVRYVAPRASAPIIIRSSPRAAPKKKHHRKHHGGGGGALNQTRLIELALGGAAYGFIEKQFGPQLPTLPIVGRAGTITLGAYYMSKGKGGLMRDIAICGAVLSGYQIGSTGKISGEMMGGIAAQI
jgi:hypothetical protein